MLCMYELVLLYLSYADARGRNRTFAFPCRGVGFYACEFVLEVYYFLVIFMESKEEYVPTRAFGGVDPPPQVV